MASCTALVLSGGCLRRYAQIGALKALASAGIRIDLVVGSSVGAVVGALFAAGCTPAEIERAAHDVVVARLKRWTLSRYGLWNGSGVDALVRRHLPCKRVEDFPTRFAAVATADGCLVSPLPVRVARSMGAQRVIAVNTLDLGRGRATGVLNSLLRSSRLMIHALAAHEAAEADVVIAPGAACSRRSDDQRPPSRDRCRRTRRSGDAAMSGRRVCARPRNAPDGRRESH